MVLPWIPVLLLVLLLLAMFTTGVALTLSAANVFFHDVNYLWGILAQLLFYASPIIYDATNPTIPKTLRMLSLARPHRQFHHGGAQRDVRPDDAVVANFVAHDHLRRRRRSPSALCVFNRLVAALRGGDVAMSDVVLSRRSPHEDVPHPSRASQLAEAAHRRQGRNRFDEFIALEDVTFDVRRGRGLRRHRPQRLGQVDAAEVHGRHPPAERGLGARPSADVGAARARAPASTPS